MAFSLQHPTSNPSLRSTLQDPQFPKKLHSQNLPFNCLNKSPINYTIGNQADRAKPEGLKVACNGFMSAAGVFGFLKENVSMKARVASSTSVDVGVECAGMLERLMLGQDQEVFFEKVVSEGRLPGLCSKFARQVGLYYEEAFAALSVPPLTQHFDRPWTAHVQLKAAQYYAEACYRCALELHEKEEIAEEIARLKSGISALADGLRKKSSHHLFCSDIHLGTKCPVIHLEYEEQGLYRNSQSLQRYGR